MAASDKAQPDEQQDNTLGQEAASNGASTQENLKQEAEQTGSEIADMYAKAQRELNDSMQRLRYEMSKFDVDEAKQRARTWVEENPTLAVFLALGAGIVAGKLISRAVRPAPPPTFSERLQRQGNVLASQAKHYARDLGGVVAGAGTVLAAKAEHASDVVSERARELGNIVAQRAEELAAAAADQAAELGDTVARQSVRAAHRVQDEAGSAAEQVREKASHGFDMAESAFGAAKTVLAALVVKRVSDWLRRMA